MSSKRIFSQIEDEADYHKPSLYDLLTFHNQVLGTQPDSLAGSFVTDTYFPLTSAALPDRTRIIPFIMGFLPPSAQVTGKVLDRSASLPQDQLSANGGNPNVANGNPVASTGPTGDPARDAMVNLAIKYPKHGGDKDPNAYFDLLGANNPDFLRQSGCALVIRGFLRKLGVDDPRISGPYKNGMAPNNIQTLAQERDAWVTSKSAGKSLPSPGDAVQVARQQNGDHWFTVISVTQNGNTATIKTVEGGQPEYDNGTDNGTGIAEKTQTWVYQDGGWQQKTSKGTKPILGWADITKVLGKEPGWQGNSSVQGDAKAGNWKSKGSSAAQQAQQSETQGAGKSANAELNRRYTAAQINVIRALQVTIQQMAATPPLKLLVNPESFKVSSQKIISDGNWGRNGAGVGIEHWGDAQDTISVSGRVAGFYAIPTDNPANGGLSRSARNFSESYQNLLSLFLIYRNNGGIWLEDFADAKGAQTVKPNNLALVGSVYIYYDSTIYIGSFDSFEISESDAAPFTLSYSFNFTVRDTFLLDRLSGAKPNAQTPQPSQDPSNIPTSQQPAPPQGSAPVAPPPPDNYVPPVVYSITSDILTTLYGDRPIVSDPTQSGPTSGAGIPLGPLDVSFVPSPKKGKK